MGRGAHKLKTILIVDDDPLVLASHKARLGSRVRILEATSREAAYRLLHRRIDAIISDYQMPDGDGISFLERCRSKNPHARRILVSGIIPDRLDDAMREGIVHCFVAKPGEPAEIVAAITTICVWCPNADLATQASSALSSVCHLVCTTDMTTALESLSKEHTDLVIAFGGAHARESIDFLRRVQAHDHSIWRLLATSEIEISKNDPIEGSLIEAYVPIPLESRQVLEFLSD